jgi:cobalt/nickel transport system ATP-binding protein
MDCLLSIENKMTQPPILSLQSVFYTYPDGTKALNGISLDIRRQSKTVFIGGNGAGKSSLFKLLTGILQPQSGSYKLIGETIIWNKQSIKLLRNKIGIVFQDPDAQLFAPSVAEELAFGLINMGLSHSQVQLRINETLEKLQISNLANRPPHLLSFGQKKKVIIAAIMAMDPDVYIFDEPMAGLDPAYCQWLMELLNELHRHGKTVIISTHDVDFAWQWAQQIIVMKNGEVIGNNLTDNVLTNKHLMQTCGLKRPMLVDIAEHLAGGVPSFYPKTIDAISHQSAIYNNTQTAIF